MPVSTHAQIRLGIVEEQSVYSQALESMLLLSPELILAGIWSDAETAVCEIPVVAPDIVLIDICLEGINGIDCIRKVKRINPDVHFLVFTGHEADDGKVFEAFRAGATGYLLKKDGPERLIRSIKELQAGGAPMSGAIARRIIDSFNHSAREKSKDHTLTYREVEVLDLLAEGKMYKEVGLQLKITMETVKKHTKHIYHKLEVQNRTEAVNKWRAY